MSPGDLLEALGTIGDAPGGIERLRELVLHLAARGQLVPQDPEDEPASEFVERIALERLVKPAGDIPEVAPDNQPWPIPPSWSWVPFRRVVDFEIGKTPATKDSTLWADQGEGHAWVSIADMTHYETVQETTRRVSTKAERETFRGPPKPAGTMMMSFKLTIGKIARIGLPAYHNEAIISIFPGLTELDPFLFRLLPLFALASDTNAAIKGATLNKTSLTKLPIALPPLAEQRRIVAKVDELMALLDELERTRDARDASRAAFRDSALAALQNAEDAEAAHAAWSRIATNLADCITDAADIAPLRQTILQLAVRGRLVPQDPEDEPASEFLDAIRNRKRTEGVRASPAGALHNREQYIWDVPLSWEWTPFGETHINYDAERVPLRSADRTQRQGPYPYYGASGPIDTIDEYLFDGDYLLIGEDGANLVNRSTPIAFIASGQFWVNNHAHVLGSVDSDSLRYLSIFVNAIDLMPHLTGIAQPKLNQRRMNVIPTPIPPLAEQRRIVAKVDELMAICDELEQRLTEAKSHQSAFAAAAVHHLQIDQQNSSKQLAASE